MHRSSLTLVVAAIVAGGLLPFFGSETASAAQLTSRKVSITSSKGGETGVDWTFTFSGDATDVEGMIFEFCTTPLGTCTLPTGMDVSAGTAAPGAQSNFPNNTTAFAEQATTLGDCVLAGDNTDTMYCVNRTEATSDTLTDATFTIENITNPTLVGSYVSVYVRISLYDNAGFDSSGGAGSELVHSGAVAASINNQLVVNGRVQERLEFCVGALGDSAATPATCAAMPTAHTVDIGVIDNSTIARSPVDNSGTNGANDTYGAAMVNTNAVSGVVIAYYAEEDGAGTNQLRAFRVPGATCDADANSTVDQCFVSADASGEAFSAGTERFGMQVACIDTDSSTSGTTNLGNVPAGYNADGDVTHSADCDSTDTSNKFAWNSTGTAATIASSATVVDDEMIKIRFGATASATTPTGAYSVTTTFIATPTF